jgi:hypothetical protein
LSVAARGTEERVRGGVAALVMASALALGACGGGDDAANTSGTNGAAQGTANDTSAQAGAAPAEGTNTAAAPAANAAPQDPLAVARRMVEIARTGELGKRPQAAQRLATMGAEGATALREVIGESTHDLASIGPELLYPLAAHGDAQLRGRVWAAVLDADYPFRPAATQALAATTTSAEWSAFEMLFTDPLSAVRAAAIGALATMDDRTHDARLVALLGDTNDGVRRAAADLLAKWGHGFALRWLVEDLARSDRYFEYETGEAARYDAARLLRRHFERELFGYDPALAPNDPANAAALVALAAAVEERANGDERRPQPAALRSDVAIDGVFGLEVRSCRRGEFHVAVTDDDRLMVGLGTPTVVPLEAGASQRLAALVATAYPSGGAPLLIGELGCDLECYRLRAGDGAALIVRVMKGPERVEGLRPSELGALAAALLAELPGDLPAHVVVPGGEGAFDALLDAALASVGGPLE